MASLGFVRIAGLPRPRAAPRLAARRAQPFAPRRVQPSRVQPSRVVWHASTTSAGGATPPKPRVTGVAAALCASALVWALLVCAAMAVVHPFVLMRDRVRRRMHEHLVMLWLRVTLRTAFVKVFVRGEKNLPAGAALFVCNHQSLLDMFAVSFLKRDMRCMVPAKAMNAPLIGWMLSLAQWIGVVGTDRKSYMKALEDAGDVLSRGSSVVVFPEGVPHPSGVMSKFPSPAFRAARKGGVPVVPVTIHGSGEMFEEGSFVPVRRAKDGITVTVHPSIPLDAGDDQAIATLAFDAIKGGLPEHLR